MSKIFILGFDDHYPRGGMLDLLTVVDTENNDFLGDSLIKPDYTIVPEKLRILVSAFAPCKFYQVVHMDMYGGILLIEHWKQARFLHLPSKYELLTGAIFESTKGDYVCLDAIQTECETSIGYIPGG